MNKKIFLLLIWMLLFTLHVPNENKSYAASKIPKWKTKTTKLISGSSFRYRLTHSKKYTIKFSSGKKSIATIHKKNGICKGKKAGKTYIYAKIYKNKKRVLTRKTKLTVLNPPVYLPVPMKLSNLKMDGTFSITYKNICTKKEFKNFSIVLLHNKTSIPCTFVSADKSGKVAHYKAMKPITYGTYILKGYNHISYSILNKEKPKRQICISVTDEMQNPLADATVELYDDGKQIHTGKTNSNGTFTYVSPAFMPKKTYSALIRKPPTKHTLYNSYEKEDILFSFSASNSIKKLVTLSPAPTCNMIPIKLFSGTSFDNKKIQIALYNFQNEFLCIENFYVNNSDNYIYLFKEKGPALPDGTYFLQISTCPLEETYTVSIKIQGGLCLTNISYTLPTSNGT